MTKDDLERTTRGLGYLRLSVLSFAIGLLIMIFAVSVSHTGLRFLIYPSLTAFSILSIGSLVLIVMAYRGMLKGSSQIGSYHRGNLILSMVFAGIFVIIVPLSELMRFPMYDTSASEPTFLHKYVYTFLRFFQNVVFILILYLPVRELSRRSESAAILAPLSLWMIFATVVAFTIGPWSRGSINTLSIYSEIGRTAALIVTVIVLTIIRKRIILRGLEGPVAQDPILSGSIPRMVRSARNSALMAGLIVPVFLLLSIPAVLVPPDDWNLPNDFERNDLSNVEYERVELQEDRDGYLSEGSSEPYRIGIVGYLIEVVVMFNWWDESTEMGWTNDPETFTVTIEVEGFDPIESTKTGSSGPMRVDWWSKDHVKTAPFVGNMTVTVSLDGSGDQHLTNSALGIIEQDDPGNDYALSIRYYFNREVQDPPLA